MKQNSCVGSHAIPKFSHAIPDPFAMTSETPLLVGLPRGILTTLRRALERVLGDQTAPLLQEAGFSSGDQLYESFAQWLQTTTDVEEPQGLAAEALGEVMSRFFAANGWGQLSIERVGPAALCITASSWAESTGDGDAEIPSCHLTTGMLAAFLGRLADDVVAVMEVECRSRGDQGCRFLAGAPETLQAVFEGMSQGTDYEAVLTAAE